MDLHETSVPCPQCLVCGEEFVFQNVETPTTPVDVDTTKLFSIFLRCVSSNSEDEIGFGLANDCANKGDVGFVFCNSCRSALIQWDKLYENYVVITESLGRLKRAIYVKILNDSNKSNKYGRKNSVDHIVDHNHSLLLQQKIQRVKDQICRQFSPSVSLKRISSSQIGEPSKNFSGFFDEDQEFEAFKNEESKEFSAKKPHRGPSRRKRRRPAPAVPVDLDGHVDDDGNNAGHDNDDDWDMASEVSSGDDDNELDDDVEINSDQDSADVDEKQLGSEPRETNKNDAKPFEIVTNGPNEWIYVGKYRITFNSEQQLYHCGLCSTVNSRRGGLMRHIRRKHIGVKRIPKVATADTVQKPKRKRSLRPTGNPNEYIFRDRFKVTCKDNEWCCGECGTQWVSKLSVSAHIRSAHIVTRGKKVRKARNYDQISPNEFRCYGKFSFRFDPDQQLYLCSLCDYTSTLTTGVLMHIRGNHYTDADKQENRAVQVAPGVYLYGGKYQIFQGEDGRFRCGLCGRSNEYLSSLYPHFRKEHADIESDEVSGAAAAGETSRNPSDVSGREKNNGDAQKRKAKPTVPLTDAARKARMSSIECKRRKKAMAKGWENQGNGTWVYKDWQVTMEQDGKYRCCTCDMIEDSKSIFSHVQSVHAKESVFNPPVRVRPADEVVELEYMGVMYKYDPTQDKYGCSLCDFKTVSRSNLRQHIKSKHVHPEKFICDICGHETDSRLAFRQHHARHEGAKYACTICGKRFTADRYLRTHLKIHMGEDAKKHQCEFCGKKFYSLKQLKNHRPSHTGETPFPCDLCGEGFATTFKRREHRKKFHGGLPQKHGWKPTEEDEEIVVAPLWVDSTGEDLLRVTEAE